MLPAEIWVNFLDNVIESIKNFGDEYWKEWGQMPTVLAHLLWREDEKVIVRDLDNVPTLNRERIKDFEQNIALNIKAQEAMQLFAFFLLNRTNYSLENLIKRYSRIAVRDKRQVTQEKNLIESGDLGIISEKQLRKEI